ncbi:MAG: leucine-rich repeat domain-containing protein [Bacteroidales bacterium]|nr:leucine-rich repeat domain-containing protein [Bacteroidales bacterium]
MKKTICIASFFLLAIGSLTAQEIIDSVLYIAEGTTQIKNSAYYGRTDFNKVVIPSSVTVINGLAFHNCTKLKEIEIPASVDSIGNAVFQNDSSLTKVTLHEGLTNLSYRLFKGIPIREITIPASVTEFGNDVFANCDSLTTIRVDKYTEAHAFFSADSRLELTDNEPAQTKEQWMATAKYNILDNGILYVSASVTKINDYQYKNNQDITEIRFSETLERIGSYAFQGIKGLKKVVIPGSVKVINEGAFAGCTNLEEVVIEEGVQDIKGYTFYGCKKLKSVSFPKSMQKIFTEGLFWETNSSILFHCYAGCDAYNIAQKSNYLIDIIDVDEQYADSITELNFSGNTVINQMSVECPNVQTIKLGVDVKKIAAEVFRNYPVASIDLDSNLEKIGENAFNDQTTLRMKNGTYADSWAKTNGYYLCAVLADLNVYTKDKSKQIEEDFTRILGDDDPYADWSYYKFNTHQPLKLEEVDGKLVLTSFMLYPCENVTVTDKDGKALISNKTIQPLTRTVLCDFDFESDNVDNYTLTTDDDFYKRLISIPTNWDISFNGFVRRPSTNTANHCETANQVHAREWIALVYNMAYVVGLPEYAERCYQAVENKELVTDEDLSVFLTKEEMDALLNKTLNYSLVLGRCQAGYGLGGGNMLYLENGWLTGISTSTSWKNTHAFWHEFSHCMGWGHQHGNMCNLERPAPWGEQCWPSIASKLYVEELEKGNPPYIDGKDFFNSKFFSKDKLSPAIPDDDSIMNDTLFIAEGMPCVDSHKNQYGFSHVVIPSSVEVIKNSALYGTAIQDVTIPESVSKIEKLAFHSCSNLQSVTIPNSVKEIGDAAFQNCPLLTSATIGSGLRELNYRLFKGSGLKEISIPSNVKIIGKEAFQDCKNLKKVVIEDGVHEIGNNAFANTAVTEIEIPASVTKIGTNITSKNVVWIVEEGSYAYEFALANNYTIKLDSGTMEENAERILAESDNAVLASSDGWKSGDFTTKYVRRRWDLSADLSNSSGYDVTFTYTGGQYKLSLSDVLFVADGKAVAFFPEERSAGSNPRQIMYSISVPKETEKLEMFALAKTGGGIDSRGTVSMFATDDGTLGWKIAKIMAEGQTAADAPIDQWDNPTFTSSDVRRRWDFSSSLNGGGRYAVTFRYTSGDNILYLSEALFSADSNAIAYFPEMRSVGASNREIVYLITVPDGTEKLELLALARKSASDAFNGTISVELLDSKVADILADSTNIEPATSDSWKSKDFTSKDVRRRWDFSDYLVGGGAYSVTFRGESGESVLNLYDVLFVADGKLVSFYPESRTTTANPNRIMYTFNVPAETKKLEMYGFVRGSDTKGTITVDYLGEIEISTNENQGEINQDEVNQWFECHVKKNQSGENQGGEGQTSVTERITNINIYTYGKTIIVENATDEIRVYDIMGQLICRDATPCVRAVLRMYGVGVYIVKVGNLAKKVIVE